MNAPQTQPIPQGDYVPATRYQSIIHTSGMTPRRDGVLVQTGPVPRDGPLEDFRDAVALACGNALTAARSLLVGEERISAVLSMDVFIAAEAGFTAHSKLADFASHHLRTEVGTGGIGSRAAVGVSTLPGNAPVEIRLVVAVQ